MGDLLRSSFAQVFDVLDSCILMLIKLLGRCFTYYSWNTSLVNFESLIIGWPLRMQYSKTCSWLSKTSFPSKALCNCATPRPFLGECTVSAPNWSNCRIIFMESYKTSHTHPRRIGRISRNRKSLPVRSMRMRYAFTWYSLFVESRGGVACFLTNIQRCRVILTLHRRK